MQKPAEGLLPGLAGSRAEHVGHVRPRVLVTRQRHGLLDVDPGRPERAYGKRGGSELPSSIGAALQRFKPPPGRLERFERGLVARPLEWRAAAA